MGSFFPGVIINSQHPGENMENGSHSPISFKYSSRFSFFCSTQTPATEFSISARAMFKRCRLKAYDTKVQRTDIALGGVML